MLQVKSRYNERTKTKFNNKPWLLLRVTQVSGSYCGSHPTLGHHCLTHTAVYLKESTGSPWMRGSVFYCWCSSKAQRKSWCFLLWLVWASKHCAVLHMANVFRESPSAWKLTSCPCPQMGDLAACESGEQIELNSLCFFFFLQGKLQIKQVPWSDNYIVILCRKSGQIRNLDILWNLL